MTFEEKKAVLLDLIKLADADGDIDLNEATFIANVAERMEVDNETLEQLYIDSHHPVPVLKDEFARIVQLQRIIMTITVDGEVLSEEIEYVRSIGLRLGLDLNTLNKVLEELPNFEKNGLPNVWESFKKHHN